MTITPSAITPSAMIDAVNDIDIEIAEDVAVAVASGSFDEWDGLLALLHAAFAHQEGRIDPPSSLHRLDAAGLAEKAGVETLFVAVASARERAPADTLVGCCFAHRTGRSLHLGKFAVAPDHQRKGIGRRLLMAAERQARSLGLDALELHTRIELDDVHRAFAAWGFERVGEHAHPGFGRPTFISMRKALPARADELIALLRLAPHPEGGWFREVFRSADSVQPADHRPPRSALTTIDFLLTRGQCSAWHRVRSDEVWHALEGAVLRLCLMSPSLDEVREVLLEPVAPRSTANAVATPRCVVPAGWWQAAEPLGPFAYVGATVGPGFDFADFDFMRDDASARAALEAHRPAWTRML